MSKYFNEKYYEYIYQSKGISNYLLDEEMILIAGDFYGIQKFIFEGLSTKNAAKVLRAKSAYIQIFTKYIAKYICKKFSIDYGQIISTNAGKFEIIAPKKYEDILESIQKDIDNFFIKNFFGLSGMSIVGVECTKVSFENANEYKKLRKQIADKIELKKFQKFSLLENDDYIMSYDEDIDNKNLCEICNIRKKEEKGEKEENNCLTCNSFVKLGELLVKDKEKINSSELGFDFDDSDIAIKIDNKLKSYIKKENNNPADFESLAKASCEGLDAGIKSLAVLKADVDSMGDFLKSSDVTDSFENFDHFSNTMDNFFSMYIPKLMREKYGDTYTVFAGGDDLFLLGAWDQVLDLAKEIQHEFKNFAKSDKLSISFGIAIAKPSYPISRLAEITEELLEKSKEVDGKDSITLFGETVKWDSYLQDNGLKEQLKVFDDNTAMLYRLLELVNMSKKVNEDMKNTMWKSKINYTFYRNVNMKSEENQKLLKNLNEMIENKPKETKMYLSEIIYKRRIV